MTQQTSLTDHPLVRDLLGSKITWHFHAMSLAEQIFEEFGNPPWRFSLFRPSPVLEGKSDHVILHHMREIARRLQASEDTKPGTDAECLACMMKVATATPLNGTAMAVTEKLFSSVVGTSLGENMGRERFPGAVDDEIASLRKKLSVSDRGPR